MNEENTPRQSYLNGDLAAETLTPEMLEKADRNIRISTVASVVTFTIIVSGATYMMWSIFVGVGMLFGAMMLGALGFPENIDYGEFLFKYIIIFALLGFVWSRLSKKQLEKNRDIARILITIINIYSLLIYKVINGEAKGPLAFGLVFVVAVLVRVGFLFIPPMREYFNRPSEIFMRWKRRWAKLKERSKK